MNITKFNIPHGKIVRVFTSSNQRVTGEFSGVSNDALLMEDCIVETPDKRYNTLGSIIKIENIEKIKVLTFSNSKFMFSDFKIRG